MHQERGHIILNTVYLLMHRSKLNFRELTQQVAGCFARAGMTVRTEPWLYESMGTLAPALFEASETQPVEAVISVGGDGTLLRANQVAILHHAPLLGVNVGNIGFLAELELEQLETACSRLQENAYTLEPRRMLQASLENGVTLTALNDVVVSRGDSARVIAVKVYVNEELVGRYIADGLIVSTPTGSTGYSLSAGGPIVSPKVECMIITPVCPHSLQHRPVITSCNQSIVLEMDHEPYRHAQLSIDGQDPITLGFQEKIFITQAPEDAQFIRIEPKGFFNLIHYKLSAWSAWS